jgi:subtilase family serine protease
VQTLGASTLLAAALTAGVPALTSTVAHTVTPAWSATATRAVPLTGTSLGVTPATTPVRIGVTLALRHEAAAKALAVALSTPGTASYGRFLSPAEVRSRFGPSDASVTAVEKYLSSEGFTHIAAEPDGLIVDADGTAAIAQKAFHTSLRSYALNGSTVFANATPALVPTSLSAIVSAVIGLSDVSMSLPHVIATPTVSTPDLSGFYPSAVQKMYDANTLKPATADTVALVVSTDPAPIIKDLRASEAKQHLPQVPVKVVYGSPASTVVTDNPFTGNAEWDLDTQISSGVAQNLKALVLYDMATITDADVARAVNLFVAQHVAQEESASLGECDYIAWLDGSMISTDEALEEGALQGQSMFASTGDNGFGCPIGASTGVPGGVPQTSWPADGTWTTAVGGTTVLADAAGNVSKEIAWIGGGGGISDFEASAPWTLRANVAASLDQYANQGGRAIPDVAAIADQFTPVEVYVDGSYEGVGGTSVASPLVAGLWARIQSARGNKLGLASANFYRLYNKANPGTVVSTPLGPQYLPAVAPVAVAGFRDVTLGTNGLYVAKAGYDNTTGIGTLDAAKLVKLL